MLLFVFTRFTNHDKCKILYKRRNQYPTFKCNAESKLHIHNEWTKGISQRDLTKQDV